MSHSVTKGGDAFTCWQDYGVDLEQRRVMLHHPISQAEGSHEIGTDHVLRSLLWMDKRRAPVELWISTPGGSIEEMWALYDVIQSMDSPVLTVGFGSVASAGCLLLACGTGTRYAMPRASLMWHSGSSDTGHVVHQEAQDRAAWEARELARWVDAMAEHTRPPRTRSRRQRRDYWERWTRGRELWLDARQMIEHGIVDQLWDDD